jgi:hypothetical protein
MFVQSKDPPLPSAVQLALDDGRLLEAIKALRQTETIDLATAKMRIDTYVQAHPQVQERLAARAREFRKSLIAWALVVDAALLIGALYWFFGR